MEIRGFQCVPDTDWFLSDALTAFTTPAAASAAHVQVQSNIESAALTTNISFRSGAAHVAKHLHWAFGNCSKPVWGSSRMDKIDEGLYLGDRCAAVDLPLLSEHGITHVVNCAEELSDIHYEQLHYRQYPLLDGAYYPPLRPSLDDGVQYIERAMERDGRVFVHCFAGISRSASIVAGYLMKKNCWTPDQAIEYIQKRRSIADPNEVFRPQLQDYYEHLKRTGTCGSASK